MWTVSASDEFRLRLVGRYLQCWSKFSILRPSMIDDMIRHLGSSPGILTPIPEIFTHMYSEPQETSFLSCPQTLSVAS
jgi:hypothetical protein